MDIDDFFTKWGASFNRRWDHLAACRDPALSLDIFFEPEYVDQAKGICNDCPVRLKCLDDAVRFDDGGIRGGMTEGERKKIRSRQRRYASQFRSDVF